MALLTTLLYIGVAILILMFLITIHELGHYLAGRMLGFKINEFAIGFGKPIFKRVSKKTGIAYSIRWLPLGGFCAFAGDDAAAGEGGSRKDADEREKKGDAPAPKGVEFNKAPPWKRLIALFSGAFFNFICAILFAIVLLGVYGYYRPVGIASVMDGNEGNFHNVVAIHGIGTKEDNIQKFTLLNSSGAVMGKYSEGTELYYLVELENGDIVARGGFKPFKMDDDGRLGIGINRNFDYKPSSMGFFELLWYSLKYCFEVAWLVLTVLWGLLTGRIGLFGNVAGPTGTVSLMSDIVQIGRLEGVLLLIPMLSVNLAVFNLLPIPALDGARMVFVGIEWVRGKPVNPIIEGRIHMIGLFLLLGFVLLADIGYWIINGNNGIFLLFGKLLL